MAWYSIFVLNTNQPFVLLLIL